MMSTRSPASRAERGRSAVVNGRGRGRVAVGARRCGGARQTGSETGQRHASHDSGPVDRRSIERSIEATGPTTVLSHQAAVAPACPPSQRHGRARGDVLAVHPYPAGRWRHLAIARRPSLMAAALEALGLYQVPGQRPSRVHLPLSSPGRTSSTHSHAELTSSPRANWLEQLRRCAAGSFWGRHERRRDVLWCCYIAALLLPMVAQGAGLRQVGR